MIYGFFYKPYNYIKGENRKCTVLKKKIKKGF